MTRLRFLIVDNQPENVAVLQSLLIRLGYDRDDVWPAKATTFRSWQEALSRLVDLKGKGWNAQDSCIVLFLDLALDKANRLFNEGVEQIRQNQVLLGDYVLVVLTLYPSYADRGLEQVVDKVFDRINILGQVDGAMERLWLLIQESVTHWAKRTGRQAPASPRRKVTVVDSAGSRHAEAAIGEELLRGLAIAVAGPETRPEIRVLTGGYSGAFVARVDWRERGGEKCVVCKVSRNKELLLNEMQAWRQAAAAYDVFTGLIPPFIDTDIKSLGASKNAWYMIQSTVRGQTLEDALLSCDDCGEAEDLIESLCGVIERITESSIKTSLKVDDVPENFFLSEVDVSRFDSSFPVLSEILSSCVEMEYLDEEQIPRKAEIDDFAKNVVRRWRSVLKERGFEQVPVYEQHGDMNPRNVLVASSQTIQLIDFARFGFWPALYDLARMELQVVLRTLDVAGAEDVFPNKLGTWWRIWEHLANGDTGRYGDSPVERGGESRARWRIASVACGELRRLCSRMGVTIDVRSAEDCVLLSRTFDAIKICSYQDASWFKKVLFLLIAVTSAKRARLL